MIQISLQGKGIGLIANQIDHQSGEVFSEITMDCGKHGIVTIRFDKTRLTEQDIRMYTDDTYDVIDANPTHPQKKYKAPSQKKLTVNMRVSGKKVNK